MPILTPILTRILPLVLMAASAVDNSWAQASGSTPQIHLIRIDHVGLNVTDLQRSADWYDRVLGFTIFHKWNTTWMIRRGDMRLGLFLRPNAVKVANLDNTIAITHFALLTDAKGFIEAQAKLKALGVAFDPPEDTGVAHSLFIYDPDGYQVEITTYYKPKTSNP
jgi:catechol 2,3-dioxygenase-like lactoylglutathione lyase family enzyme